MGRRGPPRKPSSMRLLQGVPGHHRPVDDREPKPPPGIPACPDWVGPAAKAAWEELAPTLFRMGVLTTVDRNSLIAYCVSFARWRAAEEFIAKHGEVYPLRDERGAVRCMMPFPQVAIARSLLQALRGLAAEFGLTPASRSQIATVMPPAPPSSGDGSHISFQDYVARAWRNAREREKRNQ